VTQQHRDLRLDWRRCFMQDGSLTPEGRAALADMEAYCYQIKTTFALDNDGAADALTMAMREGRRQAFLYMRHRILAPLEE